MNRRLKGILAISLFCISVSHEEAMSHLLAQSSQKSTETIENAVATLPGKKAYVQPAAFGFGNRRLGSRHGGFFQRQALPPMVGPTVLEGELVLEEAASVDGEIVLEHSGVAAEIMGDSCDSCGEHGSCSACLVLQLPCIRLDDAQIFGGVNGFKGPANRGQDGSFGFYEGINLGAPLPGFESSGIGTQLGARITQNNLSGAAFSTNERKQLFLTAGLFRRVDWGLQGGLVWDYLSDDWYYNIDVSQVRGEISWVYPCERDLGFMFSAATQDDTSTTFGTETWTPVDTYAFFYRREFEEGALGRLFAGWSGQKDGIVGADATVPMSEALSLNADFTYLIPRESTGNNGYQEETWNIAFGITWYPGCNKSRSRSYNRPLFGVANNGSLLLGRQ
ncbi:MAG: hypothetical protein MPJ24_04550 [Pirellulaceae bacterium]|nr:hypothetical protein [Pirellulaceae bacterium]